MFDLTDLLDLPVQLEDADEGLLRVSKVEREAVKENGRYQVLFEGDAPSKICVAQARLQTQSSDSNIDLC